MILNKTFKIKVVPHPCSSLLPPDQQYYLFPTIYVSSADIGHLANHACLLFISCGHTCHLIGHLAADGGNSQ